MKTLALGRCLLTIVYAGHLRYEFLVRFFGFGNESLSVEFSRIELIRIRNDHGIEGISRIGGRVHDIRMYFGQMFLDRAVMHAAIRTALTVIWFDACMNSQMNFEIGFTRKELKRDNEIN